MGKDMQQRSAIVVMFEYVGETTRFGSLKIRALTMIYLRFKTVRLIDDITVAVVRYPVSKSELDVSGEP